MSQKLIFKGTTLKFNQKKYAAAADKALRELFHGAAKAFLIATVSRIRVRTGFLRGAFTTLEDAIEIRAAAQAKRAGVPFKRTGRRSSKNTSGLIEYYYVSKRNRVLKNPTSGRPFATPAKDIITKQAGTATKMASTGRWVFKYAVDIRYLAINDLHLGWNSWNAGMAAFTQYMTANFSKVFPDINEFFIKQQVGKSQTSSGNLAQKGG